MKRGQTAILVAAVAAVAAVGVIKASGGSSSARRSGTVVVSVASSPEKLALMQDMARRFDGAREVVDGRVVTVHVYSASSGDEEASLAHSAGGTTGDRPVVWSPASSLWSRLLDAQTSTPLVPESNPSLVRSPLMIAMWEPLARALGWPHRAIGFADILNLSQDPRGWAAYGHPEYGPFKLVHTNPGVSTSGREAVTAEVSAVTHKLGGLSAAEVNSPAVGRGIAAIESSIVHYGDTTLFIADQLRRQGPAYASAVAMEETTLVDFNAHRGGQPKLVGIYPSEGTFYSDSPYVILRAPWVSSDQAAGARAFLSFLGARLDRREVARFGFRPAAGDPGPGAPFDSAHGTAPGAPPRVIALPAPQVLGQIQQLWLTHRKRANIELVLDSSASMLGGDKLVNAERGVTAFLQTLSPDDRVGLRSFSTGVHRLATVGPYSRNAAALQSALRGLLAGGSSALYDATLSAIGSIRRLRDQSRINAVVVLTDGFDNGSALPRTALLGTLARDASASAAPVRVFTIAYGRDADVGTLARIASATGGEAFLGDPRSIESVYRRISSFF